MLVSGWVTILRLTYLGHLPCKVEVFTVSRMRQQPASSWHIRPQELITLEPLQDYQLRYSVNLGQLMPLTVALRNVTSVWIRLLSTLTMPPAASGDMSPIVER